MNPLIEKLGLEPHPEGGFYKETYRSNETFETARGTRSTSTAIYFLLPKGTLSRLHRIKADELWHFYGGGPLRIIEIRPNGTLVETLLSPENPQACVPAGSWFGALPEPESEYSFVGCTVAPGFDFSDFEMGEREALLKKFPTASTWIQKLS
ncbi:MAG: cupin [Elusimicrobia bacterium]|nr:MAG: cupin [Elusimicrobiota bacterium]